MTQTLHRTDAQLKTAVSDELAFGTPGVTDIAREAGEALERCIILRVGSVTATVHEHAVTLEGQVAWQYQREAAEHAVRYLRGVVRVFNTITIKPVASKTSVKSAIDAALVRTAQSEGRHITVTVDDAGHVVPGGTDVTDELRIQY